MLEVFDKYKVNDFVNINININIKIKISSKCEFF